MNPLQRGLARLLGVRPNPHDSPHAATVVEAKASATGPLIAYQSLHQPVWSPRDYAGFAREGFMQNAIVYRAVRMIAECAASVPVLLYEAEHELSQHPLLDLMARPNPWQSGTDLLEAWYGYLLVAGNAYLEGIRIGGDVRELYALRPDRMSIVPGADGWPEAYEYKVAGQTVRFAQGSASGAKPILQVALFHPLSDYYGMSPIEAAATAIDIHNAASAWNKALLDNSARPSGALVYSGRDGRFTADQYARLKTELEESFEGARNAGRPMLLEGGLDWKAMALTPRDMDFIEAKHVAAREIALALGVPPMLLGIPGDNTYSNYQEANRTFWRHTVLPLVERTLKSLSGWLAPASGLTLRPDLDAINALTGERDALWARLQAATFLTDDEKRAAVGYGPKGGAAGSGGLAAKFNPHHDDLGRFTFGPDGAATPVAKRPSIPAKPPVPAKPGPVPVPPGKSIRNEALAGKQHPETGIPFDKQGFPDFSGVSQKTVSAPHTGIRDTDVAAANRLAGYASTPDGMTWHHHQDGYTMQLVPFDIHSKTGHTGSLGIGNTPGRR